MEAMADTTDRRIHSDDQRAFSADVLVQLAALGGAITADVTEAGLGEVSGNAPIMTLLLLQSNQPMRPRELADRVGMTTGGMTKVIDRLVDQDLVERETGTLSDGRGVLVKLTPTGTEKIALACDIAYPALRKAVDDLITLVDE